MFHKKYCKIDPFNKENKRNLRNTPKQEYNCGGYALGTFSWYCPHDEKDGRGIWHMYDYSFTTREEAWIKTVYAVSKMILDFEGNLRMIKSLDQLNKLTERVVAFRLSSDGDFHYVRKNLNGHWYHKRGASVDILEMSEREVFNTNWCGRYDGPIVLLAIKRF